MYGKLVEDMLLGIYREAVQVDFVMQVWCCASSGISYQGNLLSALDMRAPLYQVFVDMTVACQHTVSVVDNNGLAEAPFPAYECYSSVGRCNNWGVPPCGNIDALVKLFHPGERGYAIAKT